MTSSGEPSNAEKAADLRQGGTIVPGTEPAFTLSIPATLPIPILISVPHAGRAYPENVSRAMRNPAWGAARLEDRYVDVLGAAVAEATGAALLVAHAPRAMLDLNRAPDDIDWSMIAGAGAGARRAPHSVANRRARSGLGLVPRRLPGLGEVWKQRLTLGELDQRIATIHRPYHRALTETLERIRDRWGAALLLDLHSMPPLAPGGGAGVELVLGDRFGASCNPSLSAQALRHVAATGRRMAHNRPYSGGYVLDHHAARRRGIHALQIEVCRASYLDSRLDQPGPRLPAVAKVLSGLVRALAYEVAALGDPAAHRHAAE